MTSRGDKSGECAVCIHNGEYDVDLIVGKIYRVVKPKRSDRLFDIRVVDESGEDAESDERINALWPAYEAALKAGGVQYEMHMYPGTQHGFHNNSTPRYHEASVKLAWERTIAFFKKHLAGGRRTATRGRDAAQWATIPRAPAALV
jgi:dienelactone hydrolase family protein